MILGGPLSVLGEEGVEAVHGAAMRIVSEIGCEVHDDAGLELLRAAGQRVEETRDYFRFVQEDSRGLDRRWREWRAAHR